MSVDRYVAVCHSFNATAMKLREPRASRIIIALVWLTSLLSCIPVLRNSFVIGVSPHCKCRSAAKIGTLVGCERFTQKINDKSPGSRTLLKIKIN